MLKCDIHSSLSYEAPRTLGDWFMFLKQKTEDSSFLKKIFLLLFNVYLFTSDCAGSSLLHGSFCSFGKQDYSIVAARRL